MSDRVVSGGNTQQQATETHTMGDTAATYSFRDLSSQVEVQLEVASTCNTSDILVQATADSLRFTDRTTSAVLLNIFQLYSTIAANSTNHTVSHGQLTITLEKLDSSLSWPALEAHSQPPTSRQPDRDSGEQTSQALAERDKVKALLTAAQSGSVAEVQAAAEQFHGSSLAEVKDGTGKNSLHFAAQLGQTDVCHYLLTEQDFDPNQQEEAGMSHILSCLPCESIPGKHSLLSQHQASLWSASQRCVAALGCAVCPQTPSFSTCLLLFAVQSAATHAYQQHRNSCSARQAFTLVRLQQTPLHGQGTGQRVHGICSCCDGP